MHSAYNDRDFPYDLDNVFQGEISTFIDSIIDLCRVYYFEIESIQILQLLKKLRNSRAYYGNDHSSITTLLSGLGDMIRGTSSSYLAIPFLLEQLRIEKYYLGCNHPDLAFILYNIGHIYETYDKLTEAEGYLTDALRVMNKNQRKGQLYALVMYKVGKINYRQSLYENAMKSFGLAIIEQQVAYEEFHPAVAEMYINVGKFQLEIGKLQDAMDSFLEALLILRMVFGNSYFKVAECLYLIGLIHESRADFEEALNALCQALTVEENSPDDDDGDEGQAFALAILHRISLIQGSIDADNCINVLEKLNNILSKSSSDYDKVIVLSMFGHSTNEDSPQIAAAA